MIVGYAPGGGVDTTARAVTRHLGRFIPGNPAVTVQNMEGAAGIVSLNHLVRRVDFTTGDGLANRPALAKQVNPIVQSAARYPGLPLIRDVIRAEHRPLLDLVLATDTFGVPIVGPPGILAEQTTSLRKAFVSMAQDQDYQADARRVELPVGQPIEGGKLSAMMHALAEATTPAVIAEFQKLAAGK